MNKNTLLNQNYICPIGADVRHFPASHFVLPFFSGAGFGYVPGMLTSPITILLSVTGIRFVLNCNTNHEAS